MNSANFLLEEALALVAIGLPVFPVHSVRAGYCSCGKRECKSIAKHPRTERGFRDATTDGQKIQEWWRRWPDANIGLPTGSATGIVVIDIDPQNGGEQSWNQLLRQRGSLPETLTQQSGGGGWHYFFQNPMTEVPRYLAQGIDLKGEGGYIIVSPSVHASGGRYTWLKADPIGGMRRLPPLPAWVLEQASAYKQKTSEKQWKVGERNNRLASFAGQLRHKGMAEEAIAAELLSLNERLCDPPLSESEVRAIARSISRYPPASQPTGARSRRKTERNWPAPLGPPAYHGLAGEIVQLIEPHTEADVAALLLQFLCFYGNIIGRTAFYRAEQSCHYTNLFVAIVGQSSKSRKGSSLSRIRWLFEDIERNWVDKCISGGLSSGEGLIWAVRDASETRTRKNGKVTVEDDPGVSDKRLLILESEFARVLQTIERESNILSAVIRDAFDTGSMRSLSKNNPVRTTGAHISMIGHVVQEELRRYLSDTAVANGFANRILWVCARRSKCLPDGGCMDEVDWEPSKQRLREVVEFGCGVGEMMRDENARKLWHAIYPELSKGLPGLLGSVTSRAEAITMRIACIYALLDCSNEVRVEHLTAALEVWRYCEDSARYTFGDSLGHPLADQILKALRSSTVGMTKSEIRNHFNRNKPAEQIDEALFVLEEYSLAFWVPEQTGGKDAIRWFATSKSLSEAV